MDVDDVAHALVLDQIQWTKSIQGRQRSVGDRSPRSSGILGKPALISMSLDVRDAPAASVPFPSRLGRPDDYAKLVRQIIATATLNGELIRLDGALRMAPK